MELVPGFVALLQPLASTMTAPTFPSFAALATGWVFASRRAVTRMILTVGSSADKHYSSYHRVFSAARWSRDAVGLAVFELIRPLLGEAVMRAIDDTLARKRGQKIFGCGRHHDLLLSAPRRPLLLFADLVPFVFEQGPGREISACIQNTPRVGRGNGRCVAQTLHRW